MRIKSLEVRARTIVDGLSSGLNRSPYHGFSVEFTEYREYVPGDDLRYLDWKLMARRDRCYIKRYREETNLCCHLVVDLSCSMGFGSLSYSKADYSRTLTATLAYFLAQQRDAVGLLTFDAAVEEFLPARFRAGNLRQILVALERTVGGTSTNIDDSLSEVAERVSRRGLVVLISDLLVAPESIEQKLGYLRARGHEVLLLQILDPAEVDFSFRDAALFVDAESGQELYVDPNVIGEDYRRRMNEHEQHLRSVCERQGVSFERFLTNEPLEAALSTFLRKRMQRGPVMSATRRARRSA